MSARCLHIILFFKSILLYKNVAYNNETSFDWQVVQVTSLVKYSESSVLVKSTFAKVKKKKLSLLQLPLVILNFICRINIYLAYSFVR